MSPIARYLVINLIQIAFLLVFAPLLKGVLARFEEIIQGKRGPSIFQPYYDIRKLFGKNEVVSEESTWLFRFAPLIEFVMPMMVVILIPALTAYPLFFAFAGDMIAVGFLFSASGFFVVLAAMDTAQVYGGIGASRMRPCLRRVSSTTSPGSARNSDEACCRCVAWW
ncbi:MAG: NADH-quinone oxidoreductase subunit H [Rhodanobacteraceae bacterium]